MDLDIKSRFFVITGAGSGFGRAIAEKLLDEGATVLAVARSKDVLEAFQASNPEKLTILIGDISQLSVQQELMIICQNRMVDGVLINAGGPPSKSFMETELTDWDEAYRMILRWKVSLVHQLIPLMIKQNYGRIVFIESISVKQPIENLVLSNSLRLAVVGFVKSLSMDVASLNINLNILAPGYHNTAAMQRLFKKKSETSQITMAEAKESFEKHIPVGKMGEANEMAVLACWLLSPLSRYVTGQTFSHDGGLAKGIFG
jgi:3-oxoacyl-[acyl-carrier protein] reductase